MPSFRNRQSAQALFLAVFTGCFFFLGIATEAPALTAYQKKQITDYLNHPKMKMDETLFDGMQFVSGADKGKVAMYYKGYVDYLKRALRGWKMLSSADKGSDDGQALFKDLDEKTKWGQAMQAAYPAFSSGASAAKPAPDAGAKQSGQTTGGMTGYQKESITQYLNGPNMKQDAALFDGKNFVKGAPYQKTKDYYNLFVKDLNNANRAWNSKLPSTAKASPDGKALFAKLEDANAWGKAMQQAYPAYEKQQLGAIDAAKKADDQAREQSKADKAAHQKVCSDFAKQAMLPLNRDPMTRLINQQLHNNSEIGGPEEVKRHQDVAAQVASVCQSIDFALLTSKPCYFVNGRPDYDPVNWCNAAGQRDALIQASALNSAKKTIAIVGSATIQSPKEFAEKEGWLTFEGPVTFKEKLYFSAKGREKVMETVQALLASTGAKDVDILWKEQKGRLDALRQEVEKTAGTWKSPPEEADNYSTELARKQVLKMHPKAKIHKSYLSRASYKVHKNALGVPLRKTMPGYILFKVPEDPFCQLRSYTLTEQYLGGGKYQEAKGVRIGYVRFQKCP